MHINTYTLKQYQECYPDLLERYKLEYEDYNEFTFINEELKNFYDSIFDIDELNDNHEMDQILFSRKVFPQNFFEQRDYDHTVFMDAVKKSNLSSSKIIDFLESRKQELEAKDSPKNKMPETDKQYFKVGLLFAENKIYSIRKDGILEYYCLNEKFKSINALSIHLKLTRKYIDDTIKELATRHNIFRNLNYMTNIVDYCNENEITIHSEFSKKYAALQEKEDQK